MSIAARPSGPDLASRYRDAGESAIGITRPPKVLLPDGGNPAPAPAPSPDRALAREALRLIRAARSIGSQGSTWLDAASSRELDIVCHQLQPIRTRRSLAASYGREAFHSVRSGGAPTVRLAYVLRWIELGPDRA